MERLIWGINGVARAAKAAQLDSEWVSGAVGAVAKSVRAQVTTSTGEIRLESRLISSPRRVRSNPTQKLQQPHCWGSWKVFEWQRAQGAPKYPGKDTHKAGTE